MKTPASAKKGREAIAKQFREIGERFGATLTECEEPAGHDSGATIVLQFTLNGVGAIIHISDLHERHGMMGGLISWYNDQPPGEWRERRERWGCGVRYFSPGFMCAVGDLCGPRKPHKATSCADWDLLAARFQAGMRHAANHTAFLPD